MNVLMIMTIIITTPSLIPRGNNFGCNTQNHDDYDSNFHHSLEGLFLEYDKYVSMGQT